MHCKKFSIHVSVDKVEGHKKKEKTYTKMPLKTTVVGAWPKPDYLKEKLDDRFATIEQGKS